MNKRQFALSAAAFIIALAFVSCEPLRGHAVVIGYDEQAGIYDYLSAGGQNLGAIDFRLDDDSDGNRSVRLQIYGLQSAMLSAQSQIYDNMDFSIAPSAVSVSGSSTSGLYTDSSGTVKTLSIMPVSTGTIISGDGFSYSIGFVDDNNVSRPVTCTPSASGNRVSFTFATDYANRVFPNPTPSGFINGTPVTAPDRSYWLNSEGWLSKWGTLTFSYMFSTNSIPSYTSTSPYNFTYFLSTSPNTVMGYAQQIELPPATVDTLTPWDYYNNILLPYIQDEFPDLPDLPDYLIFPDGYQEPEQPTTVPVEYPTLPGFDYALETNGTEPASDYNYNIPDLPGKDVAVPQFDFTQINPAEVMAPVADGLRGIWQLIAMVLTEYGLFPYVGLAIFAAIVLMLLHLGK